MLQGHYCGWEEIHGNDVNDAHIAFAMHNSHGNYPAAQTPDCCILFTWFELTVYVLHPGHSISPPPLEYIRPHLKHALGELRGVIKGQHGSFVIGQLLYQEKSESNWHIYFA